MWPRFFSSLQNSLQAQSQRNMDPKNVAQPGLPTWSCRSFAKRSGKVWPGIVLGCFLTRWRQLPGFPRGCCAQASEGLSSCWSLTWPLHTKTTESTTIRNLDTTRLSSQNAGWIRLTQGVCNLPTLGANQLNAANVVVGGVMCKEFFNNGKSALWGSYLLSVVQKSVQMF